MLGGFCVQDAPKTLQDGPKRPESLQDGPKTPQEAAKTRPRRPQDAPRGAQQASKTRFSHILSCACARAGKVGFQGAQDGPGRPQDGPRGAQDASKTAPGRLQEPSWLPDLSREPPGSLPDPPGRPPEASGSDFHVEMLASNKDQKKTSRVQSRQFPRSIPYQQIPKVLLTHHASLGAGGRGRSP